MDESIEIIKKEIYKPISITKPFYIQKDLIKKIFYYTPFLLLLLIFN